jgi:AcrR family transcriptional regulator
MRSPKERLPDKPGRCGTASRIPRARTRVSRADKSAATRNKLLAAAAQVVGMEGYANASVAKITARARVAQGTFYNYFKSQQDLFDRLLPELGRQLLDYIRNRLGVSSDSLEREKIGFKAFFEFLHRTPEFYRVLNEAETFSPKAFRDHMDNMMQGYLRALRRNRQKGELAGYGEDELDVIVCILLATRNYLAYHYIYREGASGDPPPAMIDAYMKFVTGGVRYGERTGRAGRRHTRPAANGLSAPKIKIVSADAHAARLNAHLSDTHRDLSGAAQRGVVLALIEAAGAAVASRGSGRPLRLVNISVGSLATSRAKVLVASAHCDQRAAGIAQVSVRITEDKPGGVVAATGQLLFAAGHDPAQRYD